MAITNNRNRYLPFHTTPDVKDAIKAEVGRLNKPRSRIIHDLVVEALKIRGYDVTGHEMRIKR